MTKQQASAAALALATGLAFSTPTAAVLIDFETLADLEAVSTQFAPLGVSFANTTALRAGFSLNEADFPPRSGQMVVGDDVGAIRLTFSRPALDVEAFFTYAAPLTLTAFDALGGVLGSATSAFAENFVSSGVGAPNEALRLAFGGGIASVTIASDPAGGSFVMDDLSFNLAQQVPEPASAALLGLGLLVAARAGRKS
jgi:hypothetical protein